MLLNVTLALLVSCFLLLAGLRLTTSRLDQQQQHPLSDSNHVYIPSLGFGTWNLDRSNASEAVSLAIQTGYRHIDCAAAYGNQKEIGVGIADGIQKAGINRYDLWVTSKLWNDRYVLGKNISVQIEWIDLTRYWFSVDQSPARSSGASFGWDNCRLGAGLCRSLSHALARGINRSREQDPLYWRAPPLLASSVFTLLC